MNIKFHSSIILLLFISNLLAQNLYTDPNAANTERVFSDPNKKTNDQSQAVYDEGGQNTFTRLTEAERALDFLKKEVASLKSEIASLKSKVESGIQNSNRTNSVEEKSKSLQRPNVNYESSHVKPKSKPTPY